MDIKMIDKMKHSPLHNYAIPGLTSWLIGSPGPKGALRFFECEREHHEVIVPHSHRFDFECQVMQGHVENFIWLPVRHEREEPGDLFQVSELLMSGGPGKYQVKKMEVKRYQAHAQTHSAGETYSMKAADIHSIRFSRGARVLFFEGPQVCNATKILEPYVNGMHVNTFKVEPWMFTKK